LQETVMREEDNAQWGLVHAFVLNGRGGARGITRQELQGLVLQEQESLWLHWDRGHPHTQSWLRAQSGLNEFACNLLLEENTRPRLLALPEQQLLLFLRGLNLKTWFRCVFLLMRSGPLPCVCGRCAPQKP
jgi:zinc transporter